MAESGAGSDENPAGRTVAGLVSLGLYFYAAMMAAALVWRMGFYGESILFASAADEIVGVSPLRDFSVGLGAGLALVVVSLGWAWASRTGRALASELAALMGPLGVPNALLLALASGLAEEMFFRGALQPRAGLWLASFLFACVHFVPRRPLLPWTLFAAAAGLVFGWLFEWTGNLIAPITAHVVVNAVNLPLLERYFSPPAGKG
ncbi:MAG: CPBP family intramembrane metalloprotease [Myxococcota bacterium]|nr:CPBP family intramembrane metalloprotease [Myxococcota bacterium]